MLALFTIIIFWVIPVYVAHQIGVSKNRQGLIWGLFLGWIGVIVVALLPPSPKIREIVRTPPH